MSSAEDSELDRIEASFDYPVVLKMPESSFSIGVYKVSDRGQLKDKLALMLNESALALVQEYIYTDFDWRVGVLNGRAIYACKYFMARDHWQIYNHASSRKSGKSGAFKPSPRLKPPRQSSKRRSEPVRSSSKASTASISSKRATTFMSSK